MVLKCSSQISGVEPSRVNRINKTIASWRSSCLQRQNRQMQRRWKILSLFWRYETTETACDSRCNICNLLPFTTGQAPLHPWKCWYSQVGLYSLRYSPLVVVGQFCENLADLISVIWKQNDQFPNLPQLEVECHRLTPNWPRSLPIYFHTQWTLRHMQHCSTELFPPLTSWGQEQSIKMNFAPSLQCITRVMSLPQSPCISTPVQGWLVVRIQDSYREQHGQSWKPTKYKSIVSVDVRSFPVERSFFRFVVVGLPCLAANIQWHTKLRHTLLLGSAHAEISSNRN